MLQNKLPLEDTRSFTPFFLDYVNQKETLKPFYDQFPSPGNFNKILTNKSNSFPAEARTILRSTLERQYQNVKQSELVKSNITSLESPDTFTVTTGHQLNIFTGPLYFIYKIVTVINTCTELKKKFPEYNFVPVYWMASEDHDYDEIKYFRLYGKKYIWETTQKGAVGRFSTAGLEKIASELPGDVELFREAYTKNQKLSDAVRHYTNALFGEYGLITIDADDASLKRSFTTVIKEDILRNTTSKLVSDTNKKLEGLGYDTQVYCRDINFFYLDDSTRARIEKSATGFRVVDSDIQFSEDQLLELIEKHPARFSPNVILRPLYQEIILPNIAYIGGPAEVIYWLQLKSVFEHFKVPFPAIMPRNFAMVVDNQLKRKLDKTGLEIDILFETKNYIFNHWVLKNTKHNLTVGKERDTAASIYSELKSRAESIDKTLGPFVGAEGKRILNSLEKIEKKLLRAEKRLHSDRLRQIEEVKDSLFPGDSLQERVDNFLNFYQQDPAFIQTLINTFDPFDFRFNILVKSAQ